MMDAKKSHNFTEFKAKNRLNLVYQKGLTVIFKNHFARALFLAITVSFVFPSFGAAQFTSMYANKGSVALQDYLARQSHEKPSQATKKRVKQFDTFILYFTSFEFSRKGIRVNPNFIRALMSAESAGDPYALSNKNAIGLTQITYETGKTAAKALFDMKIDFKYIDEERLKSLEPSDLYDPAINILICTYLIDKYNLTFGDNLALTVSAWNAGPGSISQYRGYPPYDETLTLIARVNYYYIHYQNEYSWY